MLRHYSLANCDVWQKEFHLFLEAPWFALAAVGAVGPLPLDRADERVAQRLPATLAFELCRREGGWVLAGAGLSSAIWLLAWLLEGGGDLPPG